MALDKAKIREEVGRYIATKSWAKAQEELQKIDESLSRRSLECVSMLDQVVRSEKA